MDKKPFVTFQTWWGFYLLLSFTAGIGNLVGKWGLIEHLLGWL